MNRNSEDKIMVILSIVAILIIGSLVWYQAGVEEDVWNRCHPSQDITQWEALWTNTRIDNCE